MTAYPKEYFENRNNKIHKGTCFVLMPFADKFNPVYDVFKNTLQSTEINLICKRADDFHKPHIIETILENIWRSEFIIADLTDANANVFYELGLAHSVKKMDNIIIVTQNLKFVPFDLQQFRCIIYENTTEGLEKLKDEIEKTFEEASKNSFRLNLTEGRTIPFGKKLVGTQNNLYNFKIEVPHIGHGLVKMIFHFTEFRIDKPAEKVPSESLFVSYDQPTKKLERIPWEISLIETEGNTARVSLDKK